MRGPATIRFCSSSSRAFTHANKGPEEIDASLSEKLSELKPQSEKRIGALWSLANIATLIGLLGTVSGLILTFGSIAAPGLSQSDKQLHAVERHR